MSNVKKHPKSTRAWAWAFDFDGPLGKESGILCSWAEPTRKSLEANRKPSPEAKAVLVRILSESEYQCLKKGERHGRLVAEEALKKNRGRYGI